MGNDSLFRLRPDSLFQAQAKEHFGVGLAVLSFDLGVWSRCAIQVGGWAGQPTLVQLCSFFLFRIPSCAAKMLICDLARLFRTMQCSQLCTPYVRNFMHFYQSGIQLHPQKSIFRSWAIWTSRSPAPSLRRLAHKKQMKICRR